MKFSRSKTKHFCETSFKNHMLTGHLTSELQYVLMIFKRTLQKYCACHEKLSRGIRSPVTATRNDHCKVTLPWHEICNPSTDSASKASNKLQNPCACHAKRIVSEPLQIHHACQRFCNLHELLRLPRILRPVAIPAPATQNGFSTSKNAPSTWCFNDFNFQIVLARRRGANFAGFNFQKSSEPLSF